MIRLVLSTLLLLLLSGCLSTGTPYNPDGLDKNELVTVHRTTHYPHNYWLVGVNGTVLVKGWETPVAPGTHNIVWERTTVGEYMTEGRLRVTLKPNQEYRIGLLDENKLDDVSIWDIETGEVVSQRID